MAKAFALRDAPKAVKGAYSLNSGKKSQRGRQRDDTDDDSDIDIEPKSAPEKRMQAAVRAQGRLTKKGGILAFSDVSEFQVSSVMELENLVRR